MCEKGMDTAFFKDPEDLIPFGNGPYYLVKGELATDGGFGDIQIDKDTWAYSGKRDGTVVANLYVPGNLSASQFRNYQGVKVQVINDLAWAFPADFLRQKRRWSNRKSK